MEMELIDKCEMTIKYFNKMCPDVAHEGVEL